MAIDPLVKLASALSGTPGGYAVLVGSGVSRGAGVMTGWEIATDLVRRLAVAEGHETPDDPLAWYAEHHATDVDYSELLEGLAPAPGERQQLLQPYFTVTDEDREHGRKVPTGAHSALADLVAHGLVRVVITTNFDRLIERALQERGLEPNVVTSAQQVQELPPLHLIPCLLVKIHGDVTSPNIRNTLTELSEYDVEMSDLLARVLEDRGLVVCGWSVDWDPALSTIVSEHQPRIFSTFWAHRGEPSDAAAELIRSRTAVAISIEDADSFFGNLASKVEAILDLAVAAPSGLDVAVAECKRLIPDPRHRIRLHDLVLGEIRRGTAEAVDASGPFQGDFDLAEYMNRIGAVERSIEVPLGLLVALAFHADEDRHDDLLVKALEILAAGKRDSGGQVAYLNLQLYPALLAVYAVGLGALAAGRPRPLARALVEVEVPTQLSGDPMPLIYGLTTDQPTLDWAALKATEEFSQRWTPVSDLLHVRLRPLTTPYVSDEDRFDTLFDDLEYLIGVVCFDQTDWGPIGRFLWRRRRHPGPGQGDAIVTSAGLELVAAGAFRGDPDRLQRAHEGYEKLLSETHLG